MGSMGQGPLREGAGMSPPGGYANGNGHHVNPEGAEHQALIAAVARGVAKLEAAEKVFSATAKTLVREGKELRAEVRGEIDELRGSLLRVEGKVDRLVEVVGRPPEQIDPIEIIRRMQTTSVQGLTADQVIAREERVRAELEQRARGTGLFGLVAEGAVIDQLTMDRLQQLAESKAQEAAKQAAQGVVSDAKDAAVSSNKTTLIKGGIGAGLVAALVSLVAALGGSQGIVDIIDAYQDDGPAQAAPP
jgi:hypothetical protein